MAEVARRSGGRFSSSCPKSTWGICSRPTGLQTEVIGENSYLALVSRAYLILSLTGLKARSVIGNVHFVFASLREMPLRLGAIARKGAKSRRKTSNQTLRSLDSASPSG